MTIDILHPLVQSLTKSEKRYCRLLAGGQAGDKPNATERSPTERSPTERSPTERSPTERSPTERSPTRNFLRLLDCLLSHETMGDALTDDLNRQFPGATLEPARKYLYKMLMQALRQFEGDRRVDVRISQLLHDSQILYERGLEQFSQEQLTKARLLAGQHERGLYAVLAARQQAEQWVRGQFDGINEATLTRQHALVREQLERTQTALHHAALYETLLLRYRTQGTVGSPADTMRLNDLLLEEHQLLVRNRIGPHGRPRTDTSFTMQQQHLHFQSAYFRMIGDGAGSLTVYRELDALFQSNPTLRAGQPHYYVQLLVGILADLRMLEQYADMPYFIDRLRAIDTAIHHLQDTPYLVLYHQLLMRVDQECFSEAAAMLSTDPLSADAVAFERGLAQLPLAIRTEFTLLLVRISVGTGQLSAGLQRLNRVLALPVKSLPGTLNSQSRLLSLLLHARLGNADYLAYALRSAGRKRKKGDPVSTGEQLVIDLLRQWLGGRLRADSLTRIDSFVGSPADRQLLRNLDLRAWARSIMAVKA